MSSYNIICDYVMQAIFFSRYEQNIVPNKIDVVIKKTIVV